MIAASLRKLDQSSSKKTPFLMWPSCAKALVVPFGLETKRKPWLLRADHVIVAWHMLSSPDVPGLVTPPRLVTGPLQRMSKLAAASAPL